MKKNSKYLFLVLSLLFNSSLGYTQNGSSVSSKAVDEFWASNKHIKFEKLWNFKKGIYDGKINAKKYDSFVFNDLNEFSDDPENLKTNNYFKVYKDCSEIYVYDKTTKKYFQIWHIPITALRDCWSINVDLSNKNIVKITYFYDNVFVEVDLKTLLYRVVVL